MKRKRKLLIDVRPEIVELYEPDKNNNLEISTLTHGSKTKIVHKCPRCRLDKIGTVSDISRGHLLCIPCRTAVSFVKRVKVRLEKGFSIAQRNPEVAAIWSKKNKLGPDKVLSGSRKKAWFDCYKCGGEYYAAIQEITRGSRCPFCSSSRVNETNSFAKRCWQFVSELVDQSLAETSHYRSSRVVEWKCGNCTRHWFGSFKTRQKNKYFCPFCKKSKGEKTIQFFLERNNIGFEDQKKFPGLKYKRNLKLDFYVELNDKRYAIEYDGSVHRDLVGNDEKAKATLEYIRMRDDIKNKFCEQNKIILIRIKSRRIKDIERQLVKDMGVENPILSSVGGKI